MERIFRIILRTKLEVNIIFLLLIINNLECFYFILFLMFSDTEMNQIKTNILSMLSLTQKYKEAADFAEFELRDTKLAVEYCIKAQDYVQALYLARSRSILDINLGINYEYRNVFLLNNIYLCNYKIILGIILIVYYIYFFFSEKLIKSACLNTVQNLISDINAQKESFLTLIKRLIEVRKEISNELNFYGIFNTIK